jgi:hypothetical protein
MVTMHRALLLVALTAVAAAGAIGSPATADQPSSCDRPGSRTLAQSSEARIFRNRGGAFYGCLFRTGKNVFLETKSIPIRNVRTAGPFAAFSRGAYHDGQNGFDVPTTVSSIGLCRGRPGKWVAQTGDAPLGEDAVTDLELSRHGDIAWIATSGAGYAVYKLDADAKVDRKPILLAEGEEVDPRSLRLRGSHITWSQGGEPASAPLKRLVGACRG